MLVKSYKTRLPTTILLTHGSEDQFREEVERLIALLLKFPDAWPELSSSTRRCRTKRFPYALIYRTKEEQLEIVAVMHLSREPNYWVERL